MKTVILDGKTTNPGDLSWDFLKKYGEVEILTAHRAKKSLNEHTTQT